MFEPGQLSETSHVVNDYGTLGIGAAAIFALVKLISKISIFINSVTQSQEKWDKVGDAVLGFVDEAAKDRKATQEHNKRMEIHADRLENAIRHAGLPSRMPHEPTPVEPIRITQRDSEASGPVGQ